MSVESCTAFLARAQTDPELGEMLRAITDTRELVALGGMTGYRFGIEDLVTASSASAEQVSAPEAGAESGVFHYELDLGGIPELAAVVEELEHLTIKPASVDLDAFDGAFRHDDLVWTDMSPADPAFRYRYEQVMAAHWNGSADNAPRRDFHLVNLDEHVEHPLYGSYLQAKVRMVRHLSRIFACDIRFSGSMWYPPRSYRLWHTNESQPGWRMYLIDLDAAADGSDTRPFFRYMNPETRDLVTLEDRPKLLRFFKVDQDPDKLFWHCIVNGTERSRWSFGFVIPDDWMTRLQATVPIATLAHGGV
jgi:predicted ribosomally synthesized peptide with nif11-like leader